MRRGPSWKVLPLGVCQHPCPPGSGPRRLRDALLLGALGPGAMGTMGTWSSQQDTNVHRRRPRTRPSSYGPSLPPRGQPSGLAISSVSRWSGPVCSLYTQRKSQRPLKAADLGSLPQCRGHLPPPKSGAHPEGTADDLSPGEQRGHPHIPTLWVWAHLRGGGRVTVQGAIWEALPLGT